MERQYRWAAANSDLPRRVVVDAFRGSAAISRYSRGAIAHGPRYCDDEPISNGRNRSMRFDEASLDNSLASRQEPRRAHLGSYSCASADGCQRAGACCCDRRANAGHCCRTDRAPRLSRADHRSCLWHTTRPNHRSGRKAAAGRRLRANCLPASLLERTGVECRSDAARHIDRLPRSMFPRWPDVSAALQPTASGLLSLAPLGSRSHGVRERRPGLLAVGAQPQVRAHLRLRRP